MKRFTEQVTLFVITALIATIMLAGCKNMPGQKVNIGDGVDRGELYEFTHNNHSYLQFGVHSTRTIVHDPECPEEKGSATELRDYQIELQNDYWMIYDGIRLISVIKHGEVPLVDSVFLRDNE